MTGRRNFLKGVLAAGVLGSAPIRSGLALAYASKPLRMLILGGTGFTGPHHVRYALERGHRVTVFNRGNNPEVLPDGVEQLIGDRNGDLESLKGREWDVVIDIPSTLPRWVRDAAQLLKDAAGHYVFISTISVYAAHDTPGADETAAVQVLEDPDTEDMRHYGALKAAAEAEARRAFPGRATVIRPGLIIGPRDPTDRFTYWPVRIARGGEVLAPGTPNDPAQVIDARDLAAFVIRMAEMRVGGDFNATGPDYRLGFGTMLDGICDAIDADARFTWVDSEFLAAQEVAPWSHMPVWIPPSGAYAGFAQRSIAKALAHGLSFRPLADTARDTLDWFRTLPDDRQAALRAGIDAVREREVLAAWHAFQA